MKTVQALAADLQSNPFVGPLARELADIASKHGVTDLPTGPDTDTSPVFSRADEGSVGDWSGRESEAADAYNDSLDALLRLVDYRYIGSGVWHTTHSTGEFPANWWDYQTEALGEISTWLNYYAWDQFCALDLDDF